MCNDVSVKDLLCAKLYVKASNRYSLRPSISHTVVDTVIILIIQMRPQRHGEVKISVRMHSLVSSRTSGFLDTYINRHLFFLLPSKNWHLLPLVWRLGGIQTTATAVIFSTPLGCKMAATALDITSQFRAGREWDRCCWLDTLTSFIGKAPFLPRTPSSPQQNPTRESLRFTWPLPTAGAAEKLRQPLEWELTTTEGFGPADQQWPVQDNLPRSSVGLNLTQPACFMQGLAPIGWQLRFLTSLAETRSGPEPVKPHLSLNITPSNTC